MENSRTGSAWSPLVPQALEHGKHPYRNPQTESEDARPDEGISRTGRALPFHSEWGYPGPAPRWPRARPTCQAPAAAMLAPGRSPARPPCGRPRCTPHRRASNNTMATKPSRQVKIAARGSPRRAELLPFPERGQEAGDRDKDDDNEPGKPGNERHLVGWTGCGRRGSVNGD
jgi:hypothetical protein